MVSREMSVLPRDLVGTVRDGLLLAAEPEGLLHIDARHVDARHREAGLLRFKIGEARDAEGLAQPEALGDLRIDVNVGAVPRAKADECGGAHRILGLVGAG